MFQSVTAVTALKSKCQARSPEEVSTCPLFHGVGEPEAVINVGVSGPGVVNYALRNAATDLPLEELAEIIKKLSFKLSRAGELVGRAVDPPAGQPPQVPYSRP